MVLEKTDIAIFYFSDMKTVSPDIPWYTHSEVFFRSSFKGEKKFEIRDQWYTVGDHADAAHTAKSDI